MAEPVEPTWFVVQYPPCEQLGLPGDGCGLESLKLLEDRDQTGVARGLVMSDGFGAIRARVGPVRTAPRARPISRLGRATSAAGAVAGRWSLVPAAEAELDREELA